MSEHLSKTPYAKFGQHLKSLRQRASESMAELSGAVELDVSEMLKFEQGKARPSEDILLLMISHFGLKEDEAMKLWELAGYNMDKIPGVHITSDELGEVIQQVIVMPMDMRIAYSDKVHIAANNSGVIINFMQNIGLTNKQQPIARVGMSREQALRVVDVLQQSLKLSEPNISKKSSPKNLKKNTSNSDSPNS